MVITKEIETEITRFMDHYWATYLSGDIQTWSTFLTEDYKNIGGTEEEIWNNKKEIVDYSMAIVDQLVGVAEFRNKRTEVFTLDPFILVHEFADMYIKIENDWSFYGKFRLSSILQQSDGSWKVIHQHGSYPDSKTDQGEAFAFDKVSTENRELKDAIKRRTIELEHSNRELEIEGSLERVRTVSMGMKVPADMLHVCKTISLQLQTLSVNEIRNVQTAIFYESRGTYMNYEYYTKHDKTFITETSYTNHKIAKDFAKKMLQGKGEVYVTHLKGKEVKDWMAYQKTTNVFIDHFLEQATSLSYYWHSLGPVALGMSVYEPLRDDQLKLFSRFISVFELAYRRYLDIEKAEAQAKEALIEAALERVRSRTMAMQRSGELQDAALLLVHQVKALGVDSFACGFNIWDEDKKTATAWMAGEDRLQPPFKTSSSADVFFQIHEAAQKGEQLFVLEQGGEELETHYRYMATIPEFKAIMDKMAEAGLSVPTFQIIHCAFFQQGYLMFISFEPVPEAQDVFKRFAKVFEQTYTRFLDLQKAEAQAMEAQIEAGLERVRSRAIAMHKTEELLDAAELVHKELSVLGITSMNVSYAFVDEEEKYATYYSINPVDGKIMPFPFVFPHTETEVMQTILSSWKKQEPFNLLELDEEATLKHQTYIGEHIQNLITKSNRDIPFSVDAFLAVSPKKAVIYTFNFTKGYLFNIGGDLLTNMQEEIMLRFTKVFEMTYRRFLDLKQAEAQAREAKIEASLERVRAKTMAMYQSENLGQVAEVVFKELENLDLGILRCGIGIINKEKRTADAWLTSISDEGKTVQVSGTESMDLHPLLQGAYDAWLSQTDFSYTLEGEDLVQYYKTSGAGKVRLPDSQLISSADEISTQYYHLAVLEAGGLFAFSATAFPEEAKMVMKRFAAVFNQSYTRFLDLQKAEAQARESQIEAALERVRSRTLAMQNSGELSETAAVLFRQLIVLGIQPNRLYIALVNDEAGNTEFWITDEDGSKVSSAYVTNLNDNPTFKKMLNGWKEEKKCLVIDMQGEELQEYFKYLSSIHVPVKGALTQKRRVQEIAYFSKGFIGIASPDEQPPETISLLERFAAVFNLTYTRFNDLKVAEAHALQAEEDLVKLQIEKKRAEDALTELQATQRQLIQSEKMASLGELTAGIAHEIQNPLNFVNNFSEVSKELLDEMKAALDNGNTQEVVDIANDVIENLQKINHHGRRADAIVKGMLQHSRSSSGIKEPTDINALCDEYLRLSYHGLRAKDKTFNATIKSEFDPSLEKINVIPQDVGRVILNLLTNAFYAVAEKKKQNANAFNPTVTVTTLRNDGEVIITISDNGNGIPKKVLDKIFQPFFTTKPTGQGTGLGLSLSYDIIKKGHGGQLKVETIEGEGTAFKIILPV